MKRALGALTASVVVFAAVAIPASAGTAKIVWKPCADEQPGYECGTLALPIDRSKPGGPTFELAVNRHKATDPAHRLGVLFVNPGGPGGSGVEFAGEAPQYFSPQILERFDIIGFDPRGVAGSKPVLCGEDLVNKQRAAIYPRTAAEFAKLITVEKQLRADCRARTGPIYDHMSAVDVADDMDALRGALGEAKLSYYGVSYGTLFGQMYAERYGDRVRAMVLDSTVDHSLDTHAFLTSEARAVEDSFREWVKWNQRTASSALHGQNVVKIWDGLMAKAERGELTEAGGSKVPAAKLFEEVGGMGYGPEWLSFSEWIAGLHTGKKAPAPSRAAALGEPVPEPLAASLCSDFNFAIRDFKHYQQLSAAERKNAPHVRSSMLGHAATTACLASPKAVNPQHTPKLRTANKILLLNSAHDPSTPLEWAAAIHGQNKATTALVTYEGWGHRAYPYTTCTKSSTDNYLTDLKVPAGNLHCAAQEPAGADQG
ncbi:alpha/beta hydrolase [Kribbella sp. NPDC056345]|uniref:alpha/beta hydrolase n=1 Tax=Kribbella sp. NPDC056345 TaxID=3345789 RepID=UPI0035DA0BE5